MKLPTKPIEGAIIGFSGDADAGIPATYFEISLFIDLNCFSEPEKALSDTRKDIEDLYTKIQGDKCSVMFDFEIEEQKQIEAKLLIPRSNIEAAIKDAESAARRTKRTHYVGAIAFPDGSQLYGDATIGFTDDKALLVGLGRLWATCEPSKTTRHYDN